MYGLKMLVWMTQLGLSVALPPTVLILFAVWLRDKQSWGSWVVYTAVILGILLAIDGFLTTIKVMKRLSDCDKDEPPAPVSFNDHT